MIQYDAFSYEVLKNSVKGLSLDYGFTHADPNAIEDLTSLLQHFLDKVITDSKHLAEIAGRKTFNSRDVVLASTKRNVDVDSMNEFMLWTKPVLPTQILPTYPVECNDVVFSVFSDDELKERKEKGIPSFLPSLRFKDKNTEKLAKELELQNQRKKNGTRNQVLKPITSVFKNAGSFEDIMKVLSSHPRATNFRRNIASDVLVVDNRLATATAANEPNERQRQKEEEDEANSVQTQNIETAGPSSSTILGPLDPVIKEEPGIIESSQNPEIRKKHKHKEKKHHKERHRSGNDDEKKNEDKERHKKEKKKKKHRESNIEKSVLLSPKESVHNPVFNLPPVIPTVTPIPPPVPEPIKPEKDKTEKEYHKKERNKEKHKEKKHKKEKEKEIKVDKKDSPSPPKTAVVLPPPSPLKIAVNSQTTVAPSIVVPKMENVKSKIEHGKSEKGLKEKKSRDKSKRPESKDSNRPTTAEPPKEASDSTGSKKEKEKHKEKRNKDKKEKKHDKEKRHKNETPEEREERRRLKKDKKKKEKEERKRKLAEESGTSIEPAIKKIKMEESAPVSETPPLQFRPLKLRISLPPKPIATSTPILAPKIEIPEKKPPPPKSVTPLPESSSRPSSSRGFHSKYSSEKLRDKHEGIILSERVQLSKALKESMMTANVTPSSSTSRSTRPPSELKSPVRKKRRPDEILKEKKDKLPSPIVSNPVAIVEPIAGTSTTFVDKEEEKYWICPDCSVMYADGVDMVLCERCHYWYHWHCVGLTAEPLESEWYCRRCAEKLARKKQKELNYF